MFGASKLNFGADILANFGSVTIFGNFFPKIGHFFLSSFHTTFIQKALSALTLRKESSLPCSSMFAVQKHYQESFN
jgi:hypothetical protein